MEQVADGSLSTDSLQMNVYFRRGRNRVWIHLLHHNGACLHGFAAGAHCILEVVFANDTERLYTACR